MFHVTFRELTVIGHTYTGLKAHVTFVREDELAGQCQGGNGMLTHQCSETSFQMQEHRKHITSCTQVVDRINAQKVLDSIVE